MIDFIYFRSRCEDMRKNFPGLPPDEILLGDYSCALQKVHYSSGSPVRPPPPPPHPPPPFKKKKGGGGVKKEPYRGKQASY